MNATDSPNPRTIDTCEKCGIVTEVKSSGGLMLCHECNARTCPYCASDGAQYEPDVDRLVCPYCSSSWGAA